MLSVDETTDPAGNHVTIVLAGILNNEEDSPPQLIKMSFLNRVNSETIALLFLNSLKIIYKDDIQYNKILLVITDAAPYMKKAFRKLSILFPKMLYVNCFSHNINGVCETTRKISPIEIN